MRRSLVVLRRRLSSGMPLSRPLDRRRAQKNLNTAEPKVHEIMAPSDQRRSREDARDKAGQEAYHARCATRALLTHASVVSGQGVVIRIAYFVWSTTQTTNAQIARVVMELLRHAQSRLNNFARNEIAKRRSTGIRHIRHVTAHTRRLHAEGRAIID